MNVPNNKRRKASRRKIVSAFMTLMETMPLQKISVTELCKKAGVNRTTFYACFEDVYDLARQVMANLQSHVETLFHGDFNGDYLRLLQDVYDNQLYYKTCFKLGVDDVHVKPYALERFKNVFGDEYLNYHIEFFRAGLNKILQMWLDGGCRETPEQINEILKSEYVGRPNL